MMSCSRALVLDNEASDNLPSPSATDDQHAGESDNPNNTVTTDAVFCREDRDFPIKGGLLIDKKNDVGTKKKVTKLAVVRMLFGCGPNQSFRDEYNILDLMANLASICLYCFDVITDVLNGLYYYRNGKENPAYQFYFVYTISIIVVSSLVLQLYSGIFERDDRSSRRKSEKRRRVDETDGVVERGRKCFSCSQLFIILFHVFQLAPVLRYIRIIKLGLQSLKLKLSTLDGYHDDHHDDVNGCGRVVGYDRQWRKALSDVNHIRLVESFLESAPQLVLQIYIMIDSDQTPPITVVSCSVSLLGFAVVYVSYQRSIRDSRPPPRYQLTIVGCVLIAIYQALTVLSRVCALAMLLDAHVIGFAAGFGGRLLVSWMFVLCLKVDYCKGCVRKTFDALIIGLGYHFTYVNVKKDHKNKYRMTVYYLETMIENVSFAVTWYFYRDSGRGFTELLVTSPDYNYTNDIDKIDDKTALQVVCLVPAVNILGILVMIVYYMCSHPKLGCCHRDHHDDDEQIIDVEIELNDRGHVGVMVEAPPHHHHHDDEPVDDRHHHHQGPAPPAGDLLISGGGGGYHCQTWPRSSSSSSRLGSTDEVAAAPQSGAAAASATVRRPQSSTCRDDNLFASFYSTPPAYHQHNTTAAAPLSTATHHEFHQKRPMYVSSDVVSGAETSKVVKGGAGGQLLLDNVDRLLEEKKQQKAALEQKKAWLQRRIDMHKRISHMSDFQPIASHHHRPHSTLDRVTNIQPPPAPLRPPVADAMMMTGAGGDEDGDYLEHLDVFPPPSEAHFQSRSCKTYPRKRVSTSSYINHHHNNSPLLKELMKQRTAAGGSTEPATTITTFSLNDIAMRGSESTSSGFSHLPSSSNHRRRLHHHRGGHVMGVSRTMSFTVRNDEVIDSIESSL